MTTIAVQTAIGDIGEKATTELSYLFDDLINCGKFQYGLNSSGIHLLNTGDTDNGSDFTSSITYQTSDYGVKNNKRFRYVYLQVELFESTTFTISIKPNKGSWITKSVIVSGTGLQTISFTIPRLNGLGNYHTVKLESLSQFRIHAVHGLIKVKPAGIRRGV